MRAVSAPPVSATSSPATCAGLLEDATLTPAVNQIELHPGLQQAELRAFHAEHAIATEA
ncbi:protein of unknown function [Streptomyces murinus]